MAVPRTVTIRTQQDLDDVSGAFEFPCALKPRDSFRFNEIFHRKAFVVTSTDELQESFAKILPTGLEMIVTEIVQSDEQQRYEFVSYYTYLDEDGRPLFEFTKKKLREFPLGWGTGTYHVTKWDPTVAAEGRRFVTGVGLRGIGNVEFKLDRRDGKLKFIECNPRPTATDKLLRIAGLDLAWISYCQALGKPVGPIGPFRDGVRQWNPPRDLQAMREGRRLGSLTTWSWLRSLAHRQHLPTFDIHDPGPTTAVVKEFVYGLARRRNSES